ncbi:MAG: hypothetical protein M0Z27_06855 [Thermaerobacter sp.]|nr:hypothetical protein [Thermaerobacter sp.]MDA8145762.1 hypothetical protein [Thermaerobacter sp.]
MGGGPALAELWELTRQVLGWDLAHPGGEESTDLAAASCRGALHRHWLVLPAASAERLAAAHGVAEVVGCAPGDDPALLARPGGWDLILGEGLPAMTLEPARLAPLLSPGGWLSLHTFCMHADPGVARREALSGHLGAPVRRPEEWLELLRLAGLEAVTAADVSWVLADTERRVRRLLTPWRLARLAAAVAARYGWEATGRLRAAWQAPGERGFALLGYFILTGRRPEGFFPAKVP